MRLWRIRGVIRGGINTPPIPIPIPGNYGVPAWIDVLEEDVGTSQSAEALSPPLQNPVRPSPSNPNTPDSLSAGWPDEGLDEVVDEGTVYDTLEYSPT